MTLAGARSPIVVDTGVFSAGLTSRAGSRLSERYEPIVAGRALFIAAQTVMELRFGALRSGWGTPRLLRLERMLGQAQVIHTGAQLVEVCARLRATCVEVGHALGQSEHNGDLWIAATALRLSVPLVSDDGIFRDVPGLQLETVAPG